MEKAVEVVASYDKDSKRFHRFVLDEGQKIVGNIYVPKDFGKIPPKVLITLKVDGEDATGKDWKK